MLCGEMEADGGSYEIYNVLHTAVITAHVTAGITVALHRMLLAVGHHICHFA